MTLSIRARLTFWYSCVVVVVLVTGAAAGAAAQWRFALQHLDDDLLRSMATLEGVMRTEFGEGLTLEGAAEEASAEVVVPDRTLMLTRTDGSLLEVWGLPLDRAFLPQVGSSPNPATVVTPAGEQRMFSRHVEFGGHRYMAAVMAPLGPVYAQRAEVVSALALGECSSRSPLPPPEGG